ncbi:MAG: tRNA epoxyqueuosine(34) reductase QueG [Gemmatimonadota bacterium]|nr:tRNA epoxyqueuosine(34) reductase QueG [Gemmatimonadota bacterium]MDH5759859.1 tRNA epoxyqueuosine(34) reductase QueG [Gemmatimonadota bacterium]
MPEDAAGTLAAALKEHAATLGFSRCGITTPEPSEQAAFFRRWVARGYHGGMGYLAREDAVARREDPTLTMESVRSVVVVTHPYHQEDPPGVPDDRSRAVIARYARGRDYHKVVKKKLLALGRWLEGETRGGAGSTAGSGAGHDGAPVRAALPAGSAPPPVRARAYVDTGPILERDLARRAGLGWQGKNTMLIHPRAGSWFFLGVLLVDVALPSDDPFAADRCGSCRACLDACPTGALLGRDADGAPVMDARRCISYLTIEHRGPIPEELRPLMGNRVFGCDICQEVCPWNRRFAEPAVERDYAARAAWEAEWDRDPDAPDDDGEAACVEAGPIRATIPTTDGPALVDLMRMSEEEWDAYTRGSAMRRAGYAGLRRNVAIALGNLLAASATSDPEAVDALMAALSDDDQVVAEAAAWALGRVAGA